MDKLRPGAYVQVALPAAAHGRLLVPGNALLFRAEGPRVAVVDEHGIVHLHKVVIAQDLGQSLEIENGIDTTGQDHRQPERFDRGWRPRRDRAPAADKQGGIVMRARRLTAASAVLGARVPVGLHGRARLPAAHGGYAARVAHGFVLASWANRRTRRSRRTGGAASTMRRSIRTNSRRSRRTRRWPRPARTMRRRAPRWRIIRRSVCLKSIWARAPRAFASRANRPVTNYATPTVSTVQNNLQIGPTVSYDTDLFGRIRREVEGAAASAEQSARRSCERPARVDHRPRYRLFLDARTRRRDRRAEPFGGAAAKGARLRDGAARSGRGVRARCPAAKVANSTRPACRRNCF